MPQWTAPGGVMRPWTVESPYGPYTVDAITEEEAIKKAQEQQRRQPRSLLQRPPTPPDSGVQQQPQQPPPSGDGDDKGWYQSLHPLARFGLESAAVGGAMYAIPPLAPALAGSRVPRIAALGREVMKLPNVARLFGRGAAEGGVGTALFAPEGERAQSATYGMGLGGAFGVGGAYLGKAGRATKKLYDDFKDPSQRAGRILGNALEGYDQSVTQAAGGTLADVHPGVTNLVAQRAAPAAQRQLAESTAARQAGAFGEGADRLSVQLGQVLDNPPSTAAIARLRDVRRAETTRLYEPTLNGTIPRTTQRLMKNLRDRPDYVKAQSEGRVIIANLFGTEAAEKTNNVRSVHGILQALKAKKEHLYAQGDDFRAGIINEKFYRPLLKSLDDSLPQYRKAGAYARETAQRDGAFNQGLRLFDKATPTGIAKQPKLTTRQVANLPPIQKRYFRAGVMDSLFQGASQQDQAANIISAFSDRGTKNQLRAALSSDSFAELQKFVTTETKFWKTYVASQGAGAQLPDSLMDVIQIGGDVVRAGAWYSPFAFNSLVQGLTKKLVRGTEDKMYQEMVNILLSTDLPQIAPTAAANAWRGIGALPAALGAPRDRSRR